MSRILARALPLIERVTPGIAWRGKRASHEVALTFDDGPEPGVTEHLLDMLDVYECPATFFLIGARVAEAPELAREIVRRGHVVGNHGWSHRSLFRMGAEAARNEFQRTSRYIEEVTGEAPIWVRPPYGHITLDFLKMLSERPEWRGVVCDVLTGDWPGGDPEAMVIDRVAKWTHGGSIVCLHDGGNPRILKIVPRVIEAIREKRLHFAPLMSLCQPI